MDKKKISLPIIVEGRYDKATLCSIFDCRAFTTDGFGIFRSEEKTAVLRKISRDGVIILADPDGGGSQIRRFLNSVLPKDKVYNLYIPKIEGKERRKTKPSKAGTLGVEGMPREVLEKVLAPFMLDGGRAEKNEGEMLTTVDIYSDGLTGSPDSQAKRDVLSRHFDLPSGMSAKALLAALNIIATKEEYREAVETLFETH